MLKGSFVFSCFVIMVLPFLSFSQSTVDGVVIEPNGNKTIALPGANVYWRNSQIGTVTDVKGNFSIPFSGQYNALIISYVGFESDTLDIREPRKIRHVLKPSNALDEVVVQQQRDAVEKTFFSTQNVVTINSAELLKAACCNLSESFETNPAILTYSLPKRIFLWCVVLHRRTDSHLLQEVG